MDVHHPPHPNSPPKRPRRTLNRLAAAFLALGIGALAQAAFNKGSLWEGAALYLLAVIIFVLSIGQDRQKFAVSPPYRGAFAPLDLSAGWRLQTGVWLLAAAVAASFGGWFFFDNAVQLPLAWQLYGFSLTLFIVGILFLTTGNGGVGEWGRRG
ncbi:MAG TPA: hypothetical protein ENK24_00460, partial [Anaerolineae bacterium]|nr:hypothetical protein [Anaerolineae bacterium]